MRKYQLITDATADISPEVLKENPELEIIPMEVILDSKPRCYGPQGDLSVEEFYEILRQGKYGSTSQINPNTYVECFEEYLKQGQDILYLCFSSGLSATYDYGIRKREHEPLRYFMQPLLIAFLLFLCYT